VGQLGFYDLDKRPEAISGKGDAHEALNALVPFESFCAEIEAVVMPALEERKRKAGRAGQISDRRSTLVHAL
jgi:hypothetical protein